MKELREWLQTIWHVCEVCVIAFLAGMATGVIAHLVWRVIMMGWRVA